MSELIDLIFYNENLKIIEKSLQMMDLLHEQLAVNNDDTKVIKRLLDIIGNTNVSFANNEVITAHKVHANGSDPELFHESCCKYLEKDIRERIKSKVIPGFGRLNHMGHPGDGALLYLQCETCEKIFKVIPSEG
jgi:hypothetical protein